MVAAVRGPGGRPEGAVEPSSRAVPRDQRGAAEEDGMAARRKKRPRRRVRPRYTPLPLSGLKYVFSERPVIVALCDRNLPRAVRAWMVTRLVDDAAARGGRMTVRDRTARIRELTQAAVAAARSVRRAWKDPITGRLWRGRPNTWPPAELFRWVAGRARAGIHHKLYAPKRLPRRRTRSRPLGPPRRPHQPAPRKPATGRS